MKRLLSFFVLCIFSMSFFYGSENLSLLVKSLKGYNIQNCDNELGMRQTVLGQKVSNPAHEMIKYLCF
jgi:hypothetical protein